MKKVTGFRPNCPQCGTANPRSNGGRWWCTKCSKQWVKNPVPKKNNLPNRPTECPECGDSKIWSFGHSWGCMKCGRNFRKVRRTQPKVTYSDLMNAKVIEI